MSDSGTLITPEVETGTIDASTVAGAAGVSIPSLDQSILNNKCLSFSEINFLKRLWEKINNYQYNSKLLSSLAIDNLLGRIGLPDIDLEFNLRLPKLAFLLWLKERITELLAKYAVCRECIADAAEAAGLQQATLADNSGMETVARVEDQTDVGISNKVNTTSMGNTNSIVG